MIRIIRLTESDLHRIVKESVRAVLIEARDEIYITINGVPMTKKQYLAYKKQKERETADKKGEDPNKIKKPPKKPQETIGEGQASPKALAANVKKLIYSKELRTIFVFVWHGDVSFKKEQVNRIHGLYQGLNKGTDPLNKFNIIYRDIEQRVNDIETWGRKNEHAVYNKVFEIAYLLEDLNNILVTLCKNTITLKQQGKFDDIIDIKTIDPETKEIVEFDERPPVLYGRGGNREYGLFGLVFASPNRLDKVQTKIFDIIKTLRSISKNGRDALEYDPNDLRKRT